MGRVCWCGPTANIAASYLILLSRRAAKAYLQQLRQARAEDRDGLSGAFSIAIQHNWLLPAVLTGGAVCLAAYWCLILLVSPLLVPFLQPGDDESADEAMAEHLREQAMEVWGIPNSGCVLRGTVVLTRQGRY